MKHLKDEIELENHKSWLLKEEGKKKDSLDILALDNEKKSLSVPGNSKYLEDYLAFFKEHPEKGTPKYEQYSFNDLSEAKNSSYYKNLSEEEKERFLSDLKFPKEVTILYFSNWEDLNDFVTHQNPEFMRAVSEVWDRDNKESEEENPYKKALDKYYADGPKEKDAEMEKTYQTYQQYLTMYYPEKLQENMNEVKSETKDGTPDLESKEESSIKFK